MTSYDFEIVFPVLNEEHRLTRGVTQTIDFCKAHALSACYTIADNGSTDRTRQIAEDLEKQYPDVKFLSVGERGVGRALKAAWLSPRAPIVGYMDIDLATDLKHLVEMKKLFQNPDIFVVSGSRLLKSSKVTNRTALRNFTSRGFNSILKFRLGVELSDGMCGFKFIRADFFKKIFDELAPLADGWFFNTEFLVKAEWLGKKIYEIGVHWTDDGDSRVELIKIVKNYLSEIERLRLEKKARR
jgi:glycosyltransferase involved in cell wall biosynthesis